MTKVVCSQAGRARIELRVQLKNTVKCLHIHYLSLLLQGNPAVCPVCLLAKAATLHRAKIKYKPSAILNSKMSEGSLVCA